MRGARPPSPCANGQSSWPDRVGGKGSPCKRLPLCCNAEATTSPSSKWLLPGTHHPPSNIASGATAPRQAIRAAHPARLRWPTGADPPVDAVHSLAQEMQLLEQAQRELQANRGDRVLWMPWSGTRRNTPRVLWPQRPRRSAPSPDAAAQATRGGSPGRRHRKLSPVSSNVTREPR